MRISDWSSDVCSSDLLTLEAAEVIDAGTMVPVPRDGATMGELMLRGNTVMKGYLKNPAATEEAFRGGWFHTGDLAVRHPDGYIEVKIGRASCRVRVCQYV